MYAGDSAADELAIQRLKGVAYTFRIINEDSTTITKTEADYRLAGKSIYGKLTVIRFRIFFPQFRTRWRFEFTAVFGKKITWQVSKDNFKNIFSYFSWWIRKVYISFDNHLNFVPIKIWQPLSYNA